MQKYQLFNRILTAWLKIKMAGMHLSLYLEQNHLNSVSIYDYDEIAAELIALNYEQFIPLQRLIEDINGNRSPHST